MKGQQKVVETVEGNIQLQEVATGEDPTSVAIASIQSATTFSDPNIKYVFRTENGGTQVMYRVIQVAEGLQDGQTEGTNAISGFPGAQTMAQAVIQGAFSSDDGVETDNTTTETHYTYFPSTAVADTSNTLGQVSTTTTVVTAQNTEALLGQGASPGQFFVMMSTPQDVLQTGPQRTIAPRTHPYSPFEPHLSTQGQNLKHRKVDGPCTRDEKRRAQHNEVERRRRDKINNWIVQLSKIIPDCSMENTKPGQGPVSHCLADSSQNLNDVGSAESDTNASQSSKRGILSKACDYIQELRQGNLRLSEELQGLTQLQMDNQVLRQQVEDLQDKNRILHAQLRQHGVEVIIKSTPH